MNGFSGGYGGNGYGAPPPQSPYGVPQQPSVDYARGYAPPAPVPYGYGAPQYAQYPQMPYAPMSPPKNAGLAILFELLGGGFCQTFGIGHLYAGNVGVGLGLMFGYWALTVVNILLCFVAVGFVTWPLTWMAFMIISAITANNAVRAANMKAGFGTS